MIGPIERNDIAAAGLKPSLIFCYHYSLRCDGWSKILIARYFGKKDDQGTKRSTALTWLLSKPACTNTFQVILALANSQVMGLSSNNVGKCKL